MGIEELENLVGKGLQLGLQGKELHAWVEAERAKLRTQREAEREALKVAHENKIAELNAQLEQLQRQWAAVSRQDSSPSIFMGEVDPKDNGKENGESMLLPFYMEKENVFPEFETGEVAGTVGPLVHAPHMLHSKKDTLVSQVLVQGAAGGGVAASETSSTFLALSGERTKAAASECADNEAMTVHMELVLQIERKKLRKRREKYSGNGRIAKSSSANAESDKVKSGRRKCLRKKFRMHVQFKVSLVKLREVSSAGPVAKHLERHGNLWNHKVKVSCRSTSSFALGKANTRTCHKKPKQTLASRRHRGTLTRNVRNLEVTRSRKCLCRDNFHGQPCWKYKRKVW